MQESGREWTSILPSELLIWELESRWTSEFSESDWRGQNLLDWDVPYNIGKLLERRYLKWARMTHLDTSNVSYGQKKGRESNWQFDSRPLKVGNRIDFVTCRWCETYRWKSLKRAITLLQTSSQSEVCTQSYGPQNRGSSNFGNLETPIWESRDKMPFGWWSCGHANSIL
jgi:hypothetical protein